MYHKSEFYNKGMLSAHPETPVIKTGMPRAGGQWGAAQTEQPALSLKASETPGECPAGAMSLL